QWPHSVWINPTPEKHWKYTHSTQLIRQIFAERMYSMTLQGIEGAMRELTR
ncbi:MAG: VWA domain-containing protein, partial [Paracoccaceae bacterium]